MKIKWHHTLKGCFLFKNISSQHIHGMYTNCMVWGLRFHK